MIYGYARVSTKGQQRYGTSLEGQRRQILCVYPGAKIVQEAYSGAKERPQFDELVERLQRGDMLVVCKLDRFAAAALGTAASVPPFWGQQCEHRVRALFSTAYSI